QMLQPAAFQCALFANVYRFSPIIQLTRPSGSLHTNQHSTACKPVGTTPMPLAPRPAVYGVIPPPPDGRFLAVPCSGVSVRVRPIRHSLGLIRQSLPPPSLRAGAR